VLVSSVAIDAGSGGSARSLVRALLAGAGHARVANAVARDGEMLDVDPA
jgi:hypothetical protein